MVRDDSEASRKKVEQLRQSHWGNPWIARLIALGDLMVDADGEMDSQRCSDTMMEFLKLFAENREDLVRELLQIMSAGATIAAMLTHVGDRFSPGQVNAAVRMAAVRHVDDGS